MNVKLLFILAKKIFRAKITISEFLWWNLGSCTVTEVYCKPFNGAFKEYTSTENNSDRQCRSALAMFDYFIYSSGLGGLIPALRIWLLLWPCVLTELRKKLPRLGLEKNRKILIAEFIEQTHDNSYYNIVDTSLSSRHCEIFISLCSVGYKLIKLQNQFRAIIPREFLSLSLF